MTRRPFIVNIATLRRVSGARRSEYRRGPVPGLEVTGSRVPEGSDVEVDVVLEATDGGIVASGYVTAPWVGACRRCLTEVSGDLSVNVRELYERRGAASVEPAQQEQETYPIDGDTIDLEPLARDAVLLNLPQAPLCRPDCAGLCPTCGADLNQGACGCPPATADPRWAALDALRHPVSGRESQSGP